MVARLPFQPLALEWYITLLWFFKYMESIVNIIFSMSGQGHVKFSAILNN